jgi:hypothetical protein
MRVASPLDGVKKAVVYIGVEDGLVGAADSEIS